MSGYEVSDTVNDMDLHVSQVNPECKSCYETGCKLAYQICGSCSS